MGGIRGQVSIVPIGGGVCKGGIRGQVSIVPVGGGVCKGGIGGPGRIQLQRVS